MCGVALWWTGVSAGAHPATGEASAPVEVQSQRAGGQGGAVSWTVLAFAPASLLLAVTNTVTTDVAAVPLLWIIPLGLYLLTFVMTFGRQRWVPHWLAVRLQPFFLLPVAMLMYWGLHGQVLWLMLPLHWGGFFVTALVCHGELAARRPAAERLTAFYLWVSIGGLLGGVLVALIAPALFDSVAEYPIMLALASFLRPLLRPSTDPTRARMRDVGFPTVLFVGLFALAWTFSRAGGLFLPGVAIVSVAAGVFCYSFIARPVRLGLGVTAILLAGTAAHDPLTATLHQERSFFGVYRVSRHTEQNYHFLLHGTTLHGAQGQSNEMRRVLESFGNGDADAGLLELFSRMEATLPGVDGILSADLARGSGSPRLAPANEDGVQISDAEFQEALRRVRTPAALQRERERERTERLGLDNDRAALRARIDTIATLEDRARTLRERQAREAALAAQYLPRHWSLAERREAELASNQLQQDMLARCLCGLAYVHDGETTMRRNSSETNERCKTAIQKQLRDRNQRLSGDLRTMRTAFTQAGGRPGEVIDQGERVAGLETQIAYERRALERELAALRRSAEPPPDGDRSASPFANLMNRTAQPSGSADTVPESTAPPDISPVNPLPRRRPLPFETEPTTRSSTTPPSTSGSTTPTIGLGLTDPDLELFMRRGASDALLRRLDQAVRRARADGVNGTTIAAAIARARGASTLTPAVVGSIEQELVAAAPR